MKNELQISKIIFSLLFLAVTLGFAASNLMLKWDALSQGIAQNEDWTDKKACLSAVDGVLREELLGREQMVEVYGGLQRLLGKMEDNAFDTVKDRDGFLYNGNFWSGFGDDQKELAVRVRQLQDTLAQSGTKLGVVIYPKGIPEPEKRCPGIPYADDTEITEDFAGWIRYYGVPLLDLSDFAQQTGRTKAEIFFRTDHHWIPEAAFVGYTKIVEFLNRELGANLDADGRLRDWASYELKTFSNLMLGSRGRATGAVWAEGREDLTVVYPKNQGHYTLTWGNMRKQETLEGTFNQTLLCMEKLEHPSQNIYSGLAEGAYLQSGVSVLTSIVNHEAENAGKILMIRDSFSTPVGAFLAQSFSQVDMVWNLHIEEEELAQLLEENHYDYVLVAVYPSNLVTDAFPFGEGG